MSEIAEIVDKTLLNLGNQNIDPTPNAYQKEFCTVAKDMEFPVEECAKFKELVLELNKSEQKEVSDKKIESVDDLVSLLLKRVATKNLDTLASIFKSSLTPSINIELDENLAKFSIKIGNSPSLMFEEDIQKEMQSYITKRFEADQNIVKQKTEDIAKLVTLMGKYLNDAISSSGSGSDNVSNIKDKIESLDMSTGDLKELSVLQSKLVSAALSIENEMSAVGAKFKDGKSQVSKLEQKIQKLEEELDSAKKESTIDHLTGLLTRRAFDEEIQRIEGLYQRNGTQYALIFFDIDHFKNVNDTYGHMVGDEVIRHLAALIREHVRETDVSGRYGGEEFVILLADTSLKNSYIFAERLRKEVEQAVVKYNDIELKYTVSLGIAEVEPCIKNYEAWIECADAALYHSKENGRNKISLHPKQS